MQPISLFAAGKPARVADGQLSASNWSTAVLAWGRVRRRSASWWAAWLQSHVSA